MQLLIIAFVIVFITDLSGVVDNIKLFIWNKLYKGIAYNDNWRIHLLDCSLCQVWWIGLIYILINGFSFYMLGYIALLSFLTPQIKDLLLGIQNIIQKLINKLW